MVEYQKHISCVFSGCAYGGIKKICYPSWLLVDEWRTPVVLISGNLLGGQTQALLMVSRSLGPLRGRVMKMSFFILPPPIYMGNTNEIDDGSKKGGPRITQRQLIRHMNRTHAVLRTAVWIPVLDRIVGDCCAFPSKMLCFGVWTFC